MERATRLLIDICGGEAGPVIDVTNDAAEACDHPCAAASWIV
jgi:phenylalanyl-tRNA synthetase beta subunit